MSFIIIALLVLAVVVGPGLWVRQVMNKYSTPEDRYSGTGAELARYLLDNLGMQSVKVERTERGDHYDPDDKAVRLTEAHYSSKSLTAITVATHEVGHAIQDNRGYAPLKWRTRLVRLAQPAQKLAAGILIAAPFISILTRTPTTGLTMFAGGFLFLGLMPLLHLLTLPVEFDASFAKAMPLLTEGEILIQSDAPHARKILMAAACTYVAASLISLVNVARWWAILRH